MNLAFGKPSTQSSISSWSKGRTIEEDAAFVNDGVIDREDREYSNHTGFERFPWWQVDLGAAFAIDRVEIFNRRTHADRLRNFTILFSKDGERWNAVHSKADSSIFGKEGEGAYIAKIETAHLARWVRIRLDGEQVLHLRQCRVFGREPAEAELAESYRQAQLAQDEHRRFFAGRSGRVLQVGAFEVFADEKRYSLPIIGALERADYEGRERDVLREVLRPEDRVLEVGTAIGVIAMTAAAMVGPENVLTFEANPYIFEDARRNFAYNGLGAIAANNAVLKNRAHWREGEKVDFCISRDFWASRIGASISDEDIIEIIQVPTLCLEDYIAKHNANFLICDIEGGEIDLLEDADLSAVSSIVLETHYWAAGEKATSALIRKLTLDGFNIHLGLSGHHVTFLSRNL